MLIEWKIAIALVVVALALWAQQQLDEGDGPAPGTETRAEVVSDDLEVLPAPGGGFTIVLPAERAR